MAGLAADVMGMPVAASQPLMEAGLDSLAAVELRSAISARIGIALPATIALDYPTVKVRAVPPLAPHFEHRLCILHGPYYMQTNMGVEPF